MQSKVWAVVAIVLFGAAIAIYIPLNREAEPLPPLLETTPPLTAPIAQPETAPAEPAIAHPLETIAPVEPLPDLEQSDPSIFKPLIQVLGEQWKALLKPEALIHKIVVTVDNLPRKDLPAKVVPLKRVKGAFLTSGKGDALSISVQNPQRYSSYVRLIQSVDTEKLVDLYRQFYPLFQRAYIEIGYPKGYFNDRLVEAIDDLLASPEPDEPIKLVQPKILFKYADPELEARSAGQKIMIRMSRDNAGQLKTKLREIRQHVAKVPRTP